MVGGHHARSAALRNRIAAAYTPVVAARQAASRALVYPDRERAPAATDDTLCRRAIQPLSLKE
jgi:hypothetical protein